MKRIPIILNFAAALLLGATGCSTMNHTVHPGREITVNLWPDSAALQGSWSGREIGASPETPRSIVFSGTHFDYRGADPNDWGKGTFTLKPDTNPKQMQLTLRECGPEEYRGKTCSLIYKLEGDVLTAAGHEPGNPKPPPTFDTPGARHMVFKKE